MPFDLSSIAYNLQNDYGGTALGFLQKSLPNPKAIPFKMDNEDFYGTINTIDMTASPVSSC